jgi:excisionase family DNA binding protein
MDFLNVTETAEKLRLSQITVRRLIRTGAIPYHRIGSKRIFFTNEDIQKYADRCAVPATAGGGE